MIETNSSISKINGFVMELRLVALLLYSYISSVQFVTQFKWGKS
jgi:hypothetical protein